MHVSEPRRTLPRVAATVLVSAAVAVLSIPAAQSAGPARPVAPTAPADIYRGQQWTLDALHIPRAWKYSRGNGVTVAVLDTGVDGHQADLAGRVIDGPDFTGHARKPGNRYWGRHGTSMASIIAGHGHGAGAAAGVMGVAPDAKILSIRVTWELNDPMRGDHTQVDHSRDAIAKGIRYAADHGAQVISMSLGGGNLFYNGNPLEEAAIKYAQGKGVVLVASAGNDGNAANRRNYPAAYPGVVAVGAVDRAFRPAKFTNRHTYVSVAAPGVEIVSADAAGHGYILGTGTSSSAAFVAGMSALVKARYPALTSPEVKQSLEEGATHRPPDGRSTKVGTGVADALGALRTAGRINNAEHDGASVRKPGQAEPSPAPASRHGPDLMLIAVLSGGGTLVVLSLILGWRQRRRRPGDHDAMDDEPPRRAPPPSAGTRATARSAEVSPWEPRPAGATTPDPPAADVSPWEPRPAGNRPPRPPSPDLPPWERYAADPPPTAGIPSWDPRAADPPPPADLPSWERHPADPSPPADLPSWEQHPADPPPPADLPAWDHLAADPPPPADLPSWGQHHADPPPPADLPAWGQHHADPPPPADLPSWEQHLADSPPTPETPPWEPGVPDPPAAEVPQWDTRPADAPRSFDAWGESTGDPPSADDHDPRPGTRRRPGSLEPYEPQAWTHAAGNGGGNGSGDHASPPAQDFRVAGGDPLNDGPVDSSSSDIGTPLADESWESIRRGFDQLKEDARNWESISTNDVDEAERPPAQDSFDETVNLPVVSPDDEAET